MSATFQESQARRIRNDAAAFEQAWNVDASESIFLAREIEQRRQQTYDIKLKPLFGRMMIPVDNTVSNGADLVTYRQYDKVGMAKIISNYADDLPRSDALAKEFTTNVRSLGTSYGYSLQELRAAAFAQKPLEERKAVAARRAMEELIDSVARSGDANNRLMGFLNQTSTTSYTVAAGASGSAAWVNKTPDEIVTDLHGIAGNIVSSTNQVEVPDTIILPVDQYNLIAGKRMGDGTDTTVLAYFLRTSPYIKSVVPWYALKGAGTGPTDRMICYRKDPDALQLIIPQEFEQMPPQLRNLETVINCHARCGGVVVYYPLSISYGDGI